MCFICVLYIRATEQLKYRFYLQVQSNFKDQQEKKTTSIENVIT